jgi:hypothetical protein
MKPFLVSIIIACVLIGCASRQEPRVDEASLVGMTVGNAMRATGMAEDAVRIIDEPPGVPRGLAGDNAHGSKVELYVARGSVPMSVKRDWDVSAFLNRPVIGVARETDSGWVITGDVMMIRSRAQRQDD